MEKKKSKGRPSKNPQLNPLQSNLDKNENELNQDSNLDNSNEDIDNNLNPEEELKENNPVIKKDDKKQTMEKVKDNSHLKNLTGNELTVPYFHKGFEFECSYGFLFKSNGSLFEDIDELLEGGINYKVIPEESNLIHCLLLQHDFDNEGSRVSMPYLQKFNKTEYLQLKQNRLGLEFAVIYQPK